MIHKFYDYNIIIFFLNISFIKYFNNITIVIYNLVKKIFNSIKNKKKTSHYY